MVASNAYCLEFGIVNSATRPDAALQPKANKKGRLVTYNRVFMACLKEKITFFI
jgi:hypothetical protein